MVVLSTIALAPPTSTLWGMMGEKLNLELIKAD
jgi:hypothetical protein